MERLVAREEEAFGSADGVAVDRDDVSLTPLRYLLHVVHALAS